MDDLEEPSDSTGDPPPPYETRHDTPALLVTVFWEIDARRIGSQRIEGVEVPVRREYENVNGDDSL